MAGLVIFAVMALQTACQTNRTPVLPPSPTNTNPVILPTETLTPPPPTLTPEPLAARVNGQGISLAEFEAELARYHNSGTNLATENGMGDEQFVLHDMVNQVLLAQEAAKEGFVLDDASLQDHIDQLASQVNLANWLQAGGYSGESFREALRRSMAAAWMRDRIANGVPAAVEQVHAVQILLYNSELANQVYTLLQNGQDFLTLAWRYDPVTGGELGWFPRGYLPEKAIETAAFNLQPGEFSPIVQTQVGYHVLYVIERDPARPLDGDARVILQEQALYQWLEDEQQKSQIEIFIP